MNKITSWANLDFNNHLFFNSVTEINELIQPIDKYFGLDSFNYHKTFNDNSQIRLTNKIDWYKHYLSQKLYLQSIFELPAFNYSRSRIIWTNINTHSVILHDAEKFGIKHGITIIEPNHDGYEFFFLGTTTNNSSAINKYLSNFQLLDKFIQNFKLANQDLQAKLYANKTIADDWSGNELKFESINEIDKYSFLTELYQYRLTTREIECLPLLIKGYTSKQIAECLKISHRTVEDYVNNIKSKMNIATKNELILLLADQFA
ncbi:MAG: LuxR family transcriptional regulator [Neisseriaceae bacterium]|nr:MAG: LuxR family transcriptional regulator [Neisseriaceae bacterium]